MYNRKYCKWKYLNKDSRNKNHNQYKFSKSYSNWGGKMINVAFVGNPNVGKTALINQISHASLKIGN